MGFFDKLQKSKGGYIFLSHSHKDIHKVRQIRDSLERDGFEPLCFYLKCLDDDSEIEDLIMREIDAREWFILADSQNAQDSKWVQKEWAYIQRTNRKKVITVQLNDWQTVEQALKKISHNLRIFLSYPSLDVDLARRIKAELEKRDFLVYFDLDDFPGGSSYIKDAPSAIAQASQEGGVMVLLTPNAMNSLWIQKELNYAIMKGGNIIPVIVGNVELSPFFKLILTNSYLYRLPENPTDEMIEQLIDRLGREILKK